MVNEDRTGRALLAVVPDVAIEPSVTALFCSHCGTRAAWVTMEDVPSRVCQDCGLGLLLESSADVAPDAGAAFIVLDSSLSVCAVSDGAEKLLATRETDAVNRHITELLVPADAEAQGANNLAVAVTWAARGDGVTHTVTVRPSNTFGVRMSARIASCGPPRAALVVFE
jgi:hypothetical protein